MAVASGPSAAAASQLCALCGFASDIRQPGERKTAKVES